MDNDKKVLASVDQSHCAEPVADHACWAARRLQAPLTLLHVLDRHLERARGDDHSGMIGLDAQENLAEKLVEDEARRIAAAKEQGRILLTNLLNHLGDNAGRAGVANVETALRHGAFEDVLAGQAPAVRLLVLGRSGADADAEAGADAGAGHDSVGEHVESIVRTMHVPTLIVSGPFIEPKRILVAFDNGPAARRAVEMIADSALFEGMKIFLFMGGAESPEIRRQLAWAEGVLRAAGRDVRVMLKPGDVASSVTTALQENAIDMLVMGAFGHSALRSLIFGSKTAALLRAVRIPTLLLR